MAYYYPNLPAPSASICWYLVIPLPENVPDAVKSEDPLVKIPQGSGGMPLHEYPHGQRRDAKNCFRREAGHRSGQAGGRLPLCLWIPEH